MTPLRQKLIDEIQLRGFSIHTQDSYERCVTGLARFYHRSPDQIADDEIKAYLLHLLRIKKLAVGSIIVAVSALRFFYGHVLHRPTKAIEEALPRMKKPVLRPKVYSVQELERLFGCPGLSRQHRALLMTTYAAGLRVSEVCQLRIGDLLSDRHQIHVVQSKGKRTGILYFRHDFWWSAILLAALPSEGLAVSQQSLSRSSYHRGRRATGLHRGGETWGITRSRRNSFVRHSFATHLLEAASTRSTSSDCSAIAGSRPRPHTFMSVKNAWTKSAVRWI